MGDDTRKIRLVKGSRFSELEAEIKERFGLKKVPFLLLNIIILINLIQYRSL